MSHCMSPIGISMHAISSRVDVYMTYALYKPCAQGRGPSASYRSAIGKRVAPRAARAFRVEFTRLVGLAVGRPRLVAHWLSGAVRAPAFGNEPV